VGQGARDMRPPALVALSPICLLAKDGSGRNSPFAQALLKHPTTPGLDLRVLMARVPRW